VYVIIKITSRTVSYWTSCKVLPYKFYIELELEVDSSEKRHCNDSPMK